MSSHLSGLQNDHKTIMVEIEGALHRLHAEEKAKRERDEVEAQTEAMEEEQQQQQVILPLPFAQVAEVTQGSPACGAVSEVHYVSQSWFQIWQTILLCCRFVSKPSCFYSCDCNVWFFLSKGPSSWGWSLWVWFCEHRELPEPPEYCLCGTT